MCISGFVYTCVFAGVCVRVHMLVLANMHIYNGGVCVRRCVEMCPLEGLGGWCFPRWVVFRFMHATHFVYAWECVHTCACFAHYTVAFVPRFHV